MRQMIPLIAVLLLCPAVASAAEPRTETMPMSLEACLQLIRKTADDYGIAPVNIVETSEMRMVRFVLSDGSVLVTCAGGEAVFTMSPYKGGG